MSENTPSITHQGLDLFVLFTQIWKERALILLTTLAFVLIASIYIFTTAPTYLARANLNTLTPEISAQLNRLILYPQIKKEPLLIEYLGLLNDPSFINTFIQAADSDSQNLYSANHETEQLKLFFRAFNYQVHDTAKHTNFFPYTLTFKAPDPALASSELQRLITRAELDLSDRLKARYESVRRQKLKQINNQIVNAERLALNKRLNTITVLQNDNKLKQLTIQSQLEAAKAKYKAQQADRIANLKSAMRTAEILKLENPVALRDLSGSKPQNIAVEVNNESPPKYLRGIALLNAELQELTSHPKEHYPSSEIRELERKLLLLKNNHQIELLKARKDDTPFNEDLQRLKHEQVKLQNEIYPEIALRFHASTALSESPPIAPNKTLILAISAFLGVVLGTSIAAIKRSTSIRRASHTKLSV